MKGDWRKAAAPIIARVLRETAGQSKSEQNKALRAAYPFGCYDYHPRKIWLDEIRVQRGLKKDRRLKKGETFPLKVCEGQTSFLD